MEGRFSSIINVAIFLPEPGGGVERGAQGPPGRLGRQVGGQRRDGLGVVARVVGELDGYRLRRTLGVK